MTDAERLVYAVSFARNNDADEAMSTVSALRCARPDHSRGKHFADNSQVMLDEFRNGGQSIASCIATALAAAGTAELVDQLIWAVCTTHDDPSLWAHSKSDPDAFRRAVRRVLERFGAVKP